MGFSALDGLMMGTRSGALDPGVLLYLLAQGWDPARLQTLLYKQSGLLGVSGESADMRRLRASTQPRARLATDLFARRVVREIGAQAAVIGGLDVLAFTGGIGEHDALLRQQVCQSLAHLGVVVQETANQRAKGDTVAPIHASDSAVEALRFAMGSQTERFEGLTPLREQGLPRVPEALAWFVCRTVQVVEAGDHDILIGSVEDFGYGSGHGLAYAQRNFGVLAAYDD